MLCSIHLPAGASGLGEPQEAASRGSRPRFSRPTLFELKFLSSSQETPEGAAMRDWIVQNVRPLDRGRMLEHATKEGLRS